MKNILIIVLVLLSSTMGHAQKRIKGNGHKQKMEERVGTFDKVVFIGPFDFKLVKDSSSMVVMEGESNLLPYLKVQVQNHTLTIKCDPKVQLRPSIGQKIMITVPFEVLQAIALTGSGNVVSHDKIHHPSLKLSLTGSGKINISLQTSQLSTDLTGSGVVQASGEAEQLTAEITGSGSIDVLDIKAEDVTATVSGSGTIKVNPSYHLYGRVIGSGRIKYKGQPATSDTKITGSGRIEAL